VGEPRLSVVPLLDYAIRNDLPTPDVSGESALPLSVVDRIACKDFGVHPFTMYGNDWFAAA
jgi:hypothetical protein